MFVGGGANILKLEEFAKSTLRLPCSIGTTEIFGNAKTKLRDPSWFTSLGLLLSTGDNQGYSENSLGGVFNNIKSMVKAGIKQLMP